MPKNSPTIITQWELEQLQSLDQLLGQRHELRRGIRRRLMNGTAVEAGRLTVTIRVRVVQTRSIPLGIIQRLLGDGAVAMLCRAFSRRPRRELVLQENTAWHQPNL